MLHHVTGSLMTFPRPEWNKNESKYVFDHRDHQGYTINDIVPISIRYFPEHSTETNLWILSHKIARTFPPGQRILTKRDRLEQGDWDYVYGRQREEKEKGGPAHCCCIA